MQAINLSCRRLFRAAAFRGPALLYRPTSALILHTTPHQPTSSLPYSTDELNKKRKRKWVTSYSGMSIREAEKQLGFRFSQLSAVPIDTALEGKDIDKAMVDAIKERVYSHIVDYIDIEGYPTESNPYFKEANVSDLVLYTIGPIINFMRKKMKRVIHLTREKEILSKDNKVGGMEEFVVLDYITVTEEKVVLIIEAKKSSTGQAMKQIMLSLKDARDNNKGGTVYGFITTGQIWQMLSYDGTSFQMTREIMVVFAGMDEDKESWMKGCSVIVECLVVALESGGIVKQDVVH